LPAVTLPTEARPVARAARSGIVIGRYRGTVVVTVHGELDLQRAEHLDHVLADLIDGQGNLSIIVDLCDVTAMETDAERVEVFEDAAGRARRHHGMVTLSQPPALLREALRRRGIEHLVVIPDTPAASS
jgi:anti-anti-sigma factor